MCPPWAPWAPPWAPYGDPWAPDGPHIITILILITIKKQALTLIRNFWEKFMYFTSSSGFCGFLRRGNSHI